MVVTAATTSAFGADPAQAAQQVPVGFAELTGWDEDDHAAAFAAFARSCRALLQSGATPSPSLRRVAERAASAGLLQPGTLDPSSCRAFFEQNFRPVRIAPAEGHGLLTGYYEPEVRGSRRRTPRFRFPLYARPNDLVDVEPAEMPDGWDPDRRFARSTPSGLQPYFDRAAIEAGALDGRGLELVYLDDPIELYVIHVQGSARIRLEDGGLLRVAYAAKAGHPYTSLGKLLIEHGAATAETMTLSLLRQWLGAAGEAGRELMRQNRSYIFFRELYEAGLDPALGAIAAAGVQLTPGRSIAVDNRHIGYGSPVWIGAELPLGQGGAIQPFCRLMVAQDTGSAIIGPARADLFIGLGAEAGEAAGRIRQVPDSFVVLEAVTGDRS